MAELRTTADLGLLRMGAARPVTFGHHGTWETLVGKGLSQATPFPALAPCLCPCVSVCFLLFCVSVLVSITAALQLLRKQELM